MIKLIKRNWLPFAVAGLLITGVAVWLMVAGWNSEESKIRNKVTIGLLETDELRGVAVFAITNAGSKPIVVMFGKREWKEELDWRRDFASNVSLPLGFYGMCQVGTGTNRVKTMSVSLPQRRGTWRVQGTVYGRANVLQKIAMTARQLRHGVFGVTNIWVSNMVAPAYEIWSPEVASLTPLVTPVNAAHTNSPGMQSIDLITK